MSLNRSEGYISINKVIRQNFRRNVTINNFISWEQILLLLGDNGDILGCFFYSTHRALRQCCRKATFHTLSEISDAINLIHW